MKLKKFLVPLGKNEPEMLVVDVSDTEYQAEYERLLNNFNHAKDELQALLDLNEVNDDTDSELEEDAE